MKTITDLRASLFKALDDLSDKTASPETIARARAASDVAQTIINTVKVEIDYIRATGAKAGTGFMGGSGAPALPEPSAPASGTTVVEERAGVRVTRHTMK